MITVFKLFEEQLKLFPTEEFFQLKHKEDYLYHVSNIKNLDSIKKYGVLPDFGDTVRKTYSDYYDFDEPDWNEKDEESKIPIYKDIKGVSFFSETPLLGFADFGFGGQTKLNWDSIVLCVIEKNNTIFHRDNDDRVTDYEGDYVDTVKYISVYDLPLFIEGGDWFSFEEQTPEFILYGEELKKFIKQNFPKSMKKYHLTEGVSNSQTIPRGEKWYHYSDVDYIQINPNPNHSDPSGIYMFPAYAIDKIKQYWKKKKYRFVISLKPNLNILNLDKLTKEEELNIVKKLKTQNEVEFVKFMKYMNGESQYYNFWQYIRSIYSTYNLGSNHSFQSAKDFMKLGYDGIYSRETIHTYEPQIIIFDIKNITIEKIENRDNLYLPKSHIDKTKDYVYKMLKDLDFDFKWNEYEETKNNQASYYITVENKNKENKKSFSIKIYYDGDEEGNIHVSISPPTYRNYSMGAFINIYEPDWDDFSKELSRDLLKVVDEIKWDNIKDEMKME
jgi:hypothetical protein